MRTSMRSPRPVAAANGCGRIVAVRVRTHSGVVGQPRDCEIHSQAATHEPVDPRWPPNSVATRS
jgi:hypothetical protein